MNNSRLVPSLDLWQWQSRAACKGMASENLFSPTGERGPALRRREEHARRICRTCAVVDPCAGFADRTGQPYGVWGGRTARQRATAARVPDAT